MLRPRDDADVMWRELGLAQDEFFDLRGEDVDAANDHHVVRATGDFGLSSHAA